MNGQIREKYLPVGSVVLLQNGRKRVMINGFCTMDASKPDKVYDYSGVLYPEGSLSSDQTLLFDHSQIVRVDHIGLEDQEEREFKVKLAQIVAANQAGQAAPQGFPQGTNPMNPQSAENPGNPGNPGMPTSPTGF